MKLHDPFHLEYVMERLESPTLLRLAATTYVSAHESLGPSGHVSYPDTLFSVRSRQTTTFVSLYLSLSFTLSLSLHVLFLTISSCLGWWILQCHASWGGDNLPRPGYVAYTQTHTHTHTYTVDDPCGCHLNAPVCFFPEGTKHTLWTARGRRGL